MAGTYAIGIVLSLNSFVQKEYHSRINPFIAGKWAKHEKRKYNPRGGCIFACVITQGSLLSSATLGYRKYNRDAVNFCPLPVFPNGGNSLLDSLPIYSDGRKGRAEGLPVFPNGGNSLLDSLLIYSDGRKSWGEGLPARSIGWNSLLGRLPIYSNGRDGWADRLPHAICDVVGAPHMVFLNPIGLVLLIGQGWRR